jgi:TonB-dependent receptor
MRRDIARSPMALLAAASVIAICSSSAAYAQDAGTGAGATADPQAGSSASNPQPNDTAETGAVTPTTADDDAIVITGIRASLERAMDIKRNSSGVVDAIAAEDIGKFPDTNLAESLQRIPGVSIDRTNGEGSTVTVRGFGPTFNLVTVNGRQLATANVQAVGGDQGVDFNRATSRSFDFANLAPEGVSRLEVYKTGRAAVPTGGIGATINIVTARPLDGKLDGLRGSIGAKALYDVSNPGFKVTPEVSGILSWSDPNDTFGVSLFGDYSLRKAAAASVTSNDWNISTFANMPGRNANTVINNAPSDPNQLIAVPNDSRYHYSTSRHERINGQATVQFRPMETLTITGDALYAQNKYREIRSDQTNWFNRPFTEVTFDDDPVVATAVHLAENLGNSPKDIGFEQQYRATKDTLTSFGVNANWEIAEGFTLNLDANTSKSKSVPDSPIGASSILVGFGAPVVQAHEVDYTGSIPHQTWTLNDAVKGNNNGQLDIGDLGTQVQRTNAARQSQRVNQFRADLGWELGEGGRFDIGATYTNTKMISGRTQTQQTLGDWGITQVGDVASIAGDLVHQYCLQCKFDHYSPTNAEVAFRGNALDLYNAFRPAYEAQGKSVGISGSDYDVVKEKIWSGYAQFTWKGDFMSVPANLVAGVRYENTKTNADAEFNQPSAIVWNSDNDFQRVLLFTPETLVTRHGDNEYNNFLPSIDFQINPMENLVARVSYSRTLARPDYGQLFASEAANPPNRPTFIGGVPTGATGNPTLKPLVSDNLDLSLEYYYARSSYVSAGFFAKRVKNFVGISQVVRPLFGLLDPSSGAAGTRSGLAVDALNGISQPTNSDVNLFAMTALLIQNGGDVAAAQAAFLGGIDPASGNLDFNFVSGLNNAVEVCAPANAVPQCTVGGGDDASAPLLQFSVATPVNNKRGNIHGFELQGQHFFGDSGFGIQASYTKVLGDVKVDRGSDPASDVFALIGLGDSANITGIYDKYGLSARVSYNWRGSYLSAINRGASRNPVFIDSFGTVDASISYDITPNFAVSLDGINLLSEPIRTYGRSKHQLWFAQELKPRLFLGARYKF